MTLQDINSFKIHKNIILKKKLNFTYLTAKKASYFLNFNTLYLILTTKNFFQ